MIEPVSPHTDVVKVVATVEERVNSRINFIVLTFTVVSMIISMILGATVLYNTQAVITVRNNAASVVITRDKERARTCLTIATLSELLQTLQWDQSVNRTQKASDTLKLTNRNVASYAALADKLKAADMSPCPK